MAKTIATNIAAQINAEHHACLESVRGGVIHAIEAGRLLCKAKGTMAHGEWLPWLKENFDGTDRVARYYMQAHKTVVVLGINRKSISDLPLSEVLRLLSGKVPQLEDKSKSESTPWEGSSVQWNAIRARILDWAQRIDDTETAILWAQDLVNELKRITS